MTHTHFTGRQLTLGVLFSSFAFIFCVQMNALGNEAKALHVQADASEANAGQTVSMETLHSAAAKRRVYRHSRMLRTPARLHNER